MTVQTEAMRRAREGSPTFGEAFRVWLKIGCINFGGPAGQIAMMHRMLVDEKKWIDEPRFLHALNFCMLLPGPEAQKLATYVGWALHGVRGGLVAGILFVLPGALVMLALSLAYALGRGVAWVDGALFGIKAAVLVIVVEALLRIGRRALKTRLLIALAGAAFVGIFFLNAPFPLIVAGAALIGYLVARTAPERMGLKAGGDRHRAGARRIAGASSSARSSSALSSGGRRSRSRRSRSGRATCWSASGRSSPSSRWSASAAPTRCSPTWRSRRSRRITG